MIQTIDGALFARMMIHASAAISAQKQQINELNVFPVPDGDTGTNMSMTISAAAEELNKKPYPPAGGQGQLRRHFVPSVPGLCQGGEGQGDHGRP